MLLQPRHDCHRLGDHFLIHPFIYLSIQQVFIEHLLCAGSWSFTNIETLFAHAELGVPIGCRRGSRGYM